jgi:hypothetical protein
MGLKEGLLKNKPSFNALIFNFLQPVKVNTNNFVPLHEKQLSSTTTFRDSVV